LKQPADTSNRKMANSVMTSSPAGSEKGESQQATVVEEESEATV
jgi:hypothetical protein